MTATNRGAVRNEADFYPTPPNAVYALLKAIPECGWEMDDDTLWLEPAVGDGAIIRAVEAYAKNNHSDECWTHYPGWHTCDIRPMETPHKSLKHVTGDFMEVYDELDGDYSVIITNPPFSLAQEMIDTTANLMGPFSSTMVIMLQRLDFLGTIKRSEWWQKRLPDWIGVLSERPFPDACEYAWYVWNLPNNEPGCRLEVLPPFTWTPTEQMRIEL